MKKLLLILPILLFSFDFKKNYEDKNFTKICLYGIKHFQKIRKNEDIVSLVGFSCVKRDYFIYLPPIISALKHTKKARLNSIYFAILFLQKKLLISYVLDDLDISYYRFAKIDHPISIVINHIISKDFKKENDIITINDNGLVYKVYKNNENKVFIDVYKNNELLSRHWYR